METGALGESREVLLDALYAEAKQVLSRSADELRGLQERLREARAQSIAGRRHFGLRFMRERARLIGARADIDSKPAQGTTVRLMLDMGEESQAWP